MNSVFKLLPILLLGVAANCENVPAFIWGKPSVTYVPALQGYKSSEFSALIASQIEENTFTAVFVENKLSTEDLSQCKLKTQTCFKNLQNVDRKSYLPNVDDPMAAFEDTDNIQIVSITKDGELSESVSAEPGKTVIFHFDDSDFSSHDAIISDLVTKFQSEHSDMIVVYTGKGPSFQPSSERILIRKARQAPKEEDIRMPAVKVTDSKNFLLTYENFTVQVGQNVDNVVFSDVKINQTTADILTLKISGGGHELDFEFSVSAGSWQLDALVYDNKPLIIFERININQGFSYHCGNFTAISPKKEGEDRTQIWIEEAQFQPNWPEKETDEFLMFGDSWDCTGFTTSPILSGLFVILIFIIIASYGIAWIMDINAMDRFDDPKGKTISINVSE